MDTASEPIETTHGSAVVERPAPPVSAEPRTVPRSGLGRFRLAVAVYLCTRLALLALALVEQEIRHVPVIYQLANWDGRWFRALALSGYPTHVAHFQTTLGFFGLYPGAMWLLAHAFGGGGATGVTVAGLVISAIGGLVATVLVQELASGWWGERTGRRAALLFCLFPGSVVFSMVYSEGLLLPLAAGCLLALERRRWALAGVLAGIATGVEPDALALIPVCAVAAVLALRRARARRALVAPVLSLTGIAAFAAYLWAWTGTPLANYYAQHYGWGEKTDPFALVHQARSLADEISLAHFNHPTINLNLVVGLAGALFLLMGAVALFRHGRTVSVEALVWTAAIGLLTVTSEFVPPNPRLLITAFPAVVVFARAVRGRWLLPLNGALLIALSYLTYYGHTLRP
jgi:MFS family permease